MSLDVDVGGDSRGFDILPEGVLYGVFTGPVLRTVDPVTGYTTVVGTLAGVGFSGSTEVVAFSGDGTLYLIDTSRRLFTAENRVRLGK